MTPSASPPERRCLQEETHVDYEIEEQSFVGMPAMLSAQREGELLVEYNSAQKGGWYRQQQPGIWLCYDCVKPITVHMKDHIVNGFCKLNLVQRSLKMPAFSRLVECKELF